MSNTGQSELLCDFCSAQPVAWEYPCQSFNLPNLPSKAPMLGSWAACEDCHELIERGDRARLRAKVANRAFHPNSSVRPRTDQEALAIQQHIKNLHQAFFEHRQGPAKRVTIDTLKEREKILNGERKAQLDEIHRRAPALKVAERALQAMEQLARQETPQTRRKDIIAIYLAILTKIMTSRQVRMYFALNDPNEEGHLTMLPKGLPPDIATQHMVPTFIAQLREARIFEFTPVDYARLYHLADVYTTEVLGGIAWQLGGEGGANAPPDECIKVGQETVIQGARLPFPAKLPFKSCYFAWGSGFAISAPQQLTYNYNPKTTTNPPIHVATLMAKGGWCWSIMVRDQTGTLNEDGSYALNLLGPNIEITVACERTSSTQWLLPYGLAPFYCTYLIDAINNADSLIKVQAAPLSEKLNFKSLAKRTGSHFVPAPYYTVTIQPTTYEEAERSLRKAQPREWSHRWDVRAHDLRKIMRGVLPIDEKLRKKLVKRRYEIFHALNPPSSECVAFLLRRRLPPPNAGEWLAYHCGRVRDYVKGPEDKPYVPSRHRLKGGIPPINEETL